MKYRIGITFSLILALFWCAPLPAFAQQLTNIGEAESANVLEFQSKRVPKTVRVEAGGKFAYSLMGSNRIFRGTLDEIRDSTVVISGAEIKLSEFHMMESRDRKKQRKAGGLLIWSTVISLLAVVGVIVAAVYSLGNRNPSNNGFIIVIIGLGVVFYLFQILFLVGIFLYSFGRKRFDLKRYWNVRIKPKISAE